ncbi:MAG: hypothetical protein IBJ03_09300 [Gemmatimonadaceae bacterium]|nr:hypothetical protein [Gemmatimonadaceae bacterium]
MTAAIPVAVLFGCSDKPAEEAKAVVATQTPVPRPLTPSDSACPRDGTWRPCHLEDRINKAGMGIKVMDTIGVPYFPERGTRYRIGRTATMAAFYFADSMAGVKATRSLDRFRLLPERDSIGAWPEPPLDVVRSVNLILVLFGVNATQSERVRLAITAGAPQPSAPAPDSSAPARPQTLPPAPPAR